MRGKRTLHNSPRTYLLYFLLIAFLSTGIAQNEYPEEEEELGIAHEHDEHEEHDGEEGWIPDVIEEDHEMLGLEGEEEEPDWRETLAQARSELHEFHKQQRTEAPREAQTYSEFEKAEEARKESAGARTKSLPKKTTSTRAGSGRRKTAKEIREEREQQRVEITIGHAVFEAVHTAKENQHWKGQLSASKLVRIAGTAAIEVLDKVAEMKRTTRQARRMGARGEEDEEDVALLPVKEEEEDVALEDPPQLINLGAPTAGAPKKKVPKKVLENGGVIGKGGGDAADREWEGEDRPIWEEEEELEREAEAEVELLPRLHHKKDPNAPQPRKRKHEKEEEDVGHDEDEEEAPTQSHSVDVHGDAHQLLEGLWYHKRGSGAGAGPKHGALRKGLDTVLYELHWHMARWCAEFLHESVHEPGASKVQEPDSGFSEEKYRFSFQWQVAHRKRACRDLDRIGAELADRGDPPPGEIWEHEFAVPEDTLLTLLEATLPESAPRHLPGLYTIVQARRKHLPTTPPPAPPEKVRRRHRRRAGEDLDDDSSLISEPGRGAAGRLRGGAVVTAGRRDAALPHEDEQEHEEDHEEEEEFQVHGEVHEDLSMPVAVRTNVRKRRAQAPTERPKAQHTSSFDPASMGVDPEDDHHDETNLFGQ